jgi:hypothetical protein
MPWTQTSFVATPDFIVDPESIDRNSGRVIDWSQVPDSYKAGTTYSITTTAQAAAAAVAILVQALPVALPSGTVLNFAGAGRFATLTAPAAVGATSLTVEALDVIIPTATAAPYTVSKSGNKAILSGTVMAQLASGRVVPRAARPGSETAMGLLWGTAIENLPSAPLSGYAIIVGGVIYENLLPEVITAFKSELVTNGSGWVWQTYQDSTEA